MIETKKIIEAAERHLEGSDMFVVECTSTPGNEIELTDEYAAMPVEMKAVAA